MKQEETDQVKTTSWKWVFATLLVTPFVLALSLSSWLGVSQESNRSEEIFSHLGLPPADLVEANSYLYGKLFFARFRLHPEALADFVTSLERFERAVGRPREPVSFKLKRDWWDIDQAAEGVGWDRGGVHLWRADSRPDIFYAVIELEAQGSESSSEGKGSSATKSGT